MKLTLQVVSRTEMFASGPVYQLTVQIRGANTHLSDVVIMKVTKQEFDAMPPGHVFIGELVPFTAWRPNQ